MAAYICTKPKGSCASCPHYRYDKEREDNACFVKQDMLKKPSFETYKEAIALISPPIVGINLDACIKVNIIIAIITT